MGTTTTAARQEERRYANLDAAIANLEAAKKEFLSRDGVIGVGYGFKEKSGRVQQDEPAILIYVREKKDKAKLPESQFIPPTFNQVPTDVIVIQPGSSPTHDRFHGMWIDQGKVHETNPQRDIMEEPRADQDVDHVAVLEIDNTFVNGSQLDFVKATKRFLMNHPDVFDFIAFYIDTATGLPGQGSYHSGIYNKTTGINYYAGSNLDNRATFGTQKLQAMLSIGWIGNQVALHEFGHMWSAFIRNRDTQSGPNRYDLLIGTSGQGLYHWGRYFDNDHSPMDYDSIDWEQLSATQFESHSVEDIRFHFCSLDLYLMGLIPSSDVPAMYVIQNPSGSGGVITGTKKVITVQNVIWAEGVRNPAYPSTPTQWKVAFVVLTKSASASQNLISQVAKQRRDFTWEAYKATRFLGKVDTTLSPTGTFPSIQDARAATDNDRAFVGWRTTSLSTKGRVNFANNPAAFVRDRAHTDPFATVTETAFNTSHGLLLSPLTPNTTQYYEIIAESDVGLIDRIGPNPMYMRKTHDSAKPDINNVSGVVLGTSIIVKWKTDEAANSRVNYRKGSGVTLTKFDPYPTTDHVMSLTGLTPGSYFLSVLSEDAAGNLTVDDNGGQYYQFSVTAPVSRPAQGRLGDLGRETTDINTAFAKGDAAVALEMIRSVAATVAEYELREMTSPTAAAMGDPGAAFCALSELAIRLGGALELIEVTDEFVDFRALQNPLMSFSCIKVPPDAVERAAIPGISEALAKLYPGLVLEPHPGLSANTYRLRRG